MGIYFNNTFLRQLQLRQRLGSLAGVSSETHNQQSRFSSYLGHKGEAMAPGHGNKNRCVTEASTHVLRRKLTKD